MTGQSGYFCSKSQYGERIQLTRISIIDYSAVQPGGSLCRFSTAYGTASDPLVDQKIGGVNVFGDGLALYDSTGAENLGNGALA